jgi:LmbE family N-acetylglucosaminyl deacetylase
MDGLELLDVVKLVEAEIDHHKPSLILAHHAVEVNIDHRVLNDAVIAACRPQPGHSVKNLLFFEVPSSIEWRPAASGMDFTPNYFYDVTDYLAQKIEALRAYKSEMRDFQHPRSIEAVEYLARWRGAT